MRTGRHLKNLHTSFSSAGMNAESVSVVVERVCDVEDGNWENADRDWALNELVSLGRGLRSVLRDRHTRSELVERTRKAHFAAIDEKFGERFGMKRFDRAKSRSEWQDLSLRPPRP